MEHATPPRTRRTRHAPMKQHCTLTHGEVRCGWPNWSASDTVARNKPIHKDGVTCQRATTVALASRSAEGTGASHPSQ
jgi:hypothetical protein